MAIGGKLAVQVAFWVVLSGVLAGASQAAVGFSASLGRPQLVGLISVNTDLVTAYSIEMLRSRPELVDRGTAAELAMTLAPMPLPPEFRTRTWRASLLQGFANKAASA